MIHYGDLEQRRAERLQQHLSEISWLHESAIWARKKSPPVSIYHYCVFLLTFHGMEKQSTIHCCLFSSFVLDSNNSGPKYVGIEAEKMAFVICSYLWTMKRGECKKSRSSQRTLLIVWCTNAADDDERNKQWCLCDWNSSVHTRLVSEAGGFYPIVVPLSLSLSLHYLLLGGCL